MIVIFYVGRTIEYVIGSYEHEGEVQVIKSGARP